MVLIVRAVIGYSAAGRKRRAIIAIQGTVLTSNQFASTFLAHRRGTHRTIGFVSRHLGKKALFQYNTKKLRYKYKPKKANTNHRGRKEKKESKKNARSRRKTKNP
jgi:hypothetical protein